MTRRSVARCLLPVAFCLFVLPARADLLIPMDDAQTDHLRAYGVVYRFLRTAGARGHWLLNYRGGSFLLPDASGIEQEALEMGVRIERVSAANVAAIEKQIEEQNMAKIVLEKAPKVGVYAPPFKEMWDDAVMLVLDYAGIPYETFYDREVLAGKINEFEWVHIHHDDFTGQFGKFYRTFRSAPWYIRMVDVQTKLARELGYETVPRLKGEVAGRILEFVERGGFLFAMCGAIDTLDIALSAKGVDIVPEALDGSPHASDAASRLDFQRTLAFRNFKLSFDPYEYEFSDIDVSDYLNPRSKEAFVLFPFSAKFDPVPTMLTQDHRGVVEGFFGQTTNFKRAVVKPNVVVMGTIVNSDLAKYIFGGRGKGMFSFLGGHDPEDPSHVVGEAPTDVSLFKNSPGYRLILNNILFPAAKKKTRKT